MVTGGLSVTNVFPLHSDRDPCRSGVRIIGAPCGLGALDPGCALGPAVVRAAGLATRLREQGLAAAWGPAERSLVPCDASDRWDAIARFNRVLAQAVTSVLCAGERFIVVGGDHSCAVGTWSAVAECLRPQGSLGLVWIDAHMDSHTPSTSPSGAAHGMPLACLLGYGEPRLTGLLAPGAKLHPAQVCLVGVRSFEPEEARLLETLGVRVIVMDEIRRYGVRWALAEAMAIATRETAALGISIDLDALDPVDAPGVGTPVPDGLDAHDLLAALAMRDADLCGLEIAEYNPVRDPDRRTARLVVELAAAAFGKSS
ncbi:MAG: arginase [Gammaproteobacteria bacterium]